MRILRPLVAGSTSLLLALALVAPSAAADLAVTTAVTSNAFHIYTHGSTTPTAPQNLTVRPAWKGYVLNWDPPSSLSPQQVTGYVLYRLPAPGTAGNLTVTHLAPRWTAAYDQPPSGDYVYFVTAQLGGAAESLPAPPVSTADAVSNYPHCGVVGVYFTPPYYDTNLECLFPL